MVPMRDGTRLRTRITFPDTPAPWPVLLQRTPNIVGDLQWHELLKYAGSGLVTVVQATRGRGGSEGSGGFPFQADAWGGDEQDAHDAVEWVRAQPWCNGKIGAFGGSVRAYGSNLTSASGAPITGAWAHWGPAELYRTGVVYYGGALCLHESQAWFATLGSDVMDHVLAHPTYDGFWEGIDVTTRQAVREHPVLITTGWYDFVQQSAIENFVSLRRQGPPGARDQAKLVIRLVAHGTNNGEFVWPEEAKNVPPGYEPDRFFDYYLRGIENGYPDLPRVAYYMMGDQADPDAPGMEWRYAEDWPPPAQQTRFYLHPAEALSIKAPPAIADPYIYAFYPEDPAPTTGGAMHLTLTGDLDQRRVERRPDVLVFTTDVLQVPVEVTGPLHANLWVASDAVDTDFTVKLTDVYPDGRSIILNDGICRARFRDSLSDPELMTPGRVYKIPVDLWSTAHIFNTGHRIRIAVSSSNYPRFDVNPNTGAPLGLEYEQMQVARNRIYVDAARPSHVLLPITGPDTDGDGVFDYFDAFPARADETEDADGDGMGDNFEQRIIDADPNDSIRRIEDVLPQVDFDWDGVDNLTEFLDGTDAWVREKGLPVATGCWLLLAALGGGVATFLCRTARVRRNFKARG
jgi:predicted acyl esterase